jgi:hypothetical protein
MFGGAARWCVLVVEVSDVIMFSLSSQWLGPSRTTVLLALRRCQFTIGFMLLQALLTGCGLNIGREALMAMRGVGRIARIPVGRIVMIWDVLVVAVANEVRLFDVVDAWQSRISSKGKA